MSKVITRFAPSPTGYLHAGNYRTAVFAYLYAKRHQGSFIVRIEDTDAARSKKEYEENILEALSWLQLPADELYRQSDHRSRHRELLEKLVALDKAYVSKEVPQAPGDREEVIRFRNPGGTVTFKDVIHDEITTDVSELGDFIIARSYDEPVFHFAVVVDDADEGVTHVIRGGDHISNTARQMLIQRALGLPLPLYAHLPLILTEHRKKLSKRTGAKALTEYRDEGILPETMLNYLAFLGWNPGDEREYLSREELVLTFDLARVQKGSAVFDEVKLRSVNQHWMRELSDADFLTHLGRKIPQKIAPLLKERAQTFKEAREMLDGELLCLFKAPSLDKEQLLAKDGGRGIAATALRDIIQALETFPEDISSEAIKDALMPLANAEEVKGKGGRGAVLWPLRYALSGQERSPDPFTLVSVLGSREAVSRLQNAIAILEG